MWILGAVILVGLLGVGGYNSLIRRRNRVDQAYGTIDVQLTQRYGPSAIFVSAGGYHHHIGLNTWAGVGAPPPPPGAIGLRHFTVALPTEAAVADVVRRVRAAGVSVDAIEGGHLVRDPAGNAIRVAAI